MGKRKQSADKTKNRNHLPSSSGIVPCSSELQELSKEKSSLLVESSENKLYTSSMDITDNSVKLLNTHTSLSSHHYNLGRSIFIKRSRHHYGHHYSRRNSVNRGNASSSHGKGPPSCDGRLLYKLSTQCNAESGQNAENSENPFGRPERMRSSSLVKDASSADAVKMVCGICQKPLRRKPYLLGITNAVSSGDYCIVGVLVCGHVYHADCLEKRTSAEEGCDPPCPLCTSVPLQVGSSGAQE
ncbi:uncharacterized protein LOC123200057 [Mangifera indica]|uniref:uncharacterized protein LOC123200057 n=1 Tax=Mangifera indica TaxID=29780 RepID=UPI001CFC4093|nr:uncharacterized protein LOC123200057 [Mangifera indica]